ncbi:MAG: glycoside hydrolase family 43 protein [Adhaeribacter sp.]
MMKNAAAWLLLLFVFSCSPDSREFNPGKEVLLYSYFKGNGDGLHLAYSTDGYRWKALKNDKIFLKPRVGQDKLMRDPCIIRGADNKFHMVWTVSWNERGLGYASSTDLVNWSKQQYVPVMEHEARARNTWAPEITYDPKTGEYMIYWASTITGLYPETQAKAESAYNHRIYYVTTRDFKTYSPTRLLYEPGFNVIDATIVPDQEGYIMFLKDETIEPARKYLRVARAGKLTGPWSAPGPAITGPYWAEGPTAFRMDGQWLVYFDKYTEHAMGAVASADLEKWTDISKRISFPKGMRHGTIFEVSQEEFARLQQ